MASPSPISPRVVEQIQIAPPPGTAPGALPLTYHDINWLYLPPGSRVFMYAFPHPTDHFVAHHLPALKSSLSDTLRTFFPFSGSLRPGPGGRSLEISYVEGQDSVPFTVAESDDDFHELCSEQPRHSTRLSALTPRLPRCDASGSVPLLAVQATVFPGTGLSIGFSSHHVSSDDLSFMHFVRTWATAHKLDGTPLPPPPFYDRSLVADPDDLCSKYLASLPPLPADQPPPATETDVFFASFTLKRDDIERLKRKALARAGPPFHCTSFVVTFAHVWVSLFKAQGRSAARKRAHAVFTADIRGRVKPALPAEYFGNCQCPCLVETSMGDLLGDDGFAAAAEAIGRAIEGLSVEGGWVAPDIVPEDIVAFGRERPMSVAGSPRTGVYGVDFGWGKPLNVQVISIGDSAISISESRDGSGGTVIGLAMPVQEIDEFRSRFFDGLRF